MVTVSFHAIWTNKGVLFIFISYIVLFVNQGLLVTASQEEDKTYTYNITLVVIFTETLKLIFSWVLSLRRFHCKDVLIFLLNHQKLGALYLVPAFLYCLYNNLSFLNLSSFDPTTYFVLLQLKVLVTGLLFQCLFRKKLSFIQWSSLVVLTAGCILKAFSVSPLLSANNITTTISYNTSDIIPVETETSKSSSWNILAYEISLVSLQIFCSSFASVYNEKLLKHYGQTGPLFGQNIFICFESIVINLIWLLAREDVQNVFSREALLHYCDPYIIAIILNNAVIGIVTVFFLKKMNSVLKNYASALELALTAILSWVLFGIPITMWTVLSLFLVSLALFIYVMNPIKEQTDNLPPTSTANSSLVEDRTLGSLADD